MTRQQAKEMVPIIQAFAKEKIIKYKDLLEEWTRIEENEGVSVICPPSDYRIKPQLKYRPFKSQEECREEMHKHPDFGWIIAKDSKIMYHIYVIGIGHVLIDSMSISFPETFAEYEFTDGTPFGIKEE